MRKLAVVLFTLFVALPAFGLEAVVVWNAAEEVIPDNSEAVSQANERMQSIKVNTRARGNVEHWWGDKPAAAGTDDNGMHRHGAARCFVQDGEPTTLSDGSGTLDSTTPGEQAVKNLADSASNSGGAIEDDVGHGRCWIDVDGADGVTAANCTGAGTDDDTGLPDTSGTSACCTGAGTGPTCDDDNAMLYTYLGVAGDTGGAWAAAKVTEAVLADTATAMTAGGVSFTTDDQILAGSANLVYNGSFEATDGTGLAAATAVPSGWAAVDAATFTYGTTTDPDVRWGDGVYAIVTDVDSGDGMSITLNNLNTATTYKVIARVAEEAADDICTMTTTGALSDITPAVSAGIAWQTLSGTFTTHATVLDDVTLIFTNTAAGDICNWDHVAVYQVGDVTTDRDEVGVPGPVYVEAILTGGGVAMANAATVAAVSGLAVTVIPPTQNCIVDVHTEYSVIGSGNGAKVLCELWENATLKVNRFIKADEDEANDGTMHYTTSNPTPGTALAYTLKCADGFQIDADTATFECDVATNAVLDGACFLNATMMCGGH